MASTYLLVWEKYSKDPVVHPVRVLDVVIHEGGPWVEFTFTGGAQDGMRSGAPLQHIITEKERSIIDSASADIFLKRAQAKQIDLAARDVYHQATANLSDPGRAALITPEHSR